MTKCLKDQFHKYQNAPAPFPTMLHSEQKCAHFCSEWSIVGYGTGAFWDLWIRSIAHKYPTLSDTGTDSISRVLMVKSIVLLWWWTLSDKLYVKILTAPIYTENWFIIGDILACCRLGYKLLSKSWIVASCMEECCVLWAAPLYCLVQRKNN